MLVRSSLALILGLALAPPLAGCPSKTVMEEVTPEPPEPSGPPRGDALRAAVLGHWTGTAHDGTETTEDVDLTMSAESYDISAGVVIGSNGWKIADDIVWLEGDEDNELESRSICFRPSSVTATALVGQWAFSDDDRCSDEWYDVTLERR